MIPAENAVALAALRDLHAVEVAIAWRLPAVFRCAAAAGLRASLEAWTAGASARSARLRATGAAVNGPGSTWMAGLIEDAERATQDLPAGPMLDWALALAARRMLAGAVFGYEALMPLAEGAVADALAANVGEHRDVAAALTDCVCAA